jgi:hypothetical protein
MSSPSPSRSPNLEQLKKQAIELLRGLQARTAAH